MTVNEPLSLDWLAAVLDSADEVNAVWPGADFPFNRVQWQDRFLDHADNQSIFIERDGRRIGHAGLMGGDEPGRLHLAHFFLIREVRGHGLGRDALRELERHASRNCGCRRMTLRTNDWNPRAIRLYTANGYVEEWRDEDFLFMSKDLASP